ncbi:MAG: hypothetical protein HYW50_01210 [Candidatus Diapherotrites archaeon]|nr:hypothetical protein [Candidatus Diapherotrites archaeon]
METESKQILKELKGIRNDIEYLKGHLTVADALLTDDDLESIREAEKDLKAGKTKRLI